MKASLPAVVFVVTLFSLCTHAAPRTWVGLGGNVFWATTANWSGGTPPGAADDVMFPNATPVEGTQNNLVGALHSLNFGVGGYSIVGNNLILTNGINATNATGTAVVATTILAGANQSITNLNSGTELLIANLDLFGHGVTFRGAGTNFIYNSILDSTGGGGLTNAGTGAFQLGGTNSNFTGPTALNAGTNIITASYLRSPITWTAGTLGGTGQLGSVTASGSSAKILAPGYLGDTGTLTSTNLVLNSFVTVLMHINGTNSATDFDQIVIGGTSGIGNLGNATLSLAFAPNFSPLVGTTFFLIYPAKPGGLLTGTFAGLPEGASVTNNGIVCQVSYNFGHGVVLTVTDVPSTGVSRYWTGGAGDAPWSHTNNWQGNVLPQQGDTIIFDQSHIAAVPPTISSNDLSPEMTFASLHFQIRQASTKNFTVLGNSLRFSSGVFVEPTPGDVATGQGTCIVSNHISLNNAASFTNTLGSVGFTATLRLAGGVELGANTVALGAQLSFGQILFDSPVTGAGVLEVDGGAGTLQLNASNAITGSIQVKSGTLTAGHPQALGSASAGPVQIGTNGVLRLLSANTTYTGSSVVLTGRLESASNNVTLAATLIGSGSNALVVLSNASVLVSPSLTLLGPVTNSAQLTFAAGFAGMLQLPSGTIVQGGGALRNLRTLNADGVIHNAVQIGDATHLGNLNSAGQIDLLTATNGGVVSPGSALDTNLAYSPLQVGTLVLGLTNTTLAISLFPNRPGGGPTNTAIFVTSAPTLGNASLSVIAQTNLTPNQQFNIVRNLSSAPVTNTFNNLPEGGFLGAGGGNFGLQISYVGGAGHDVVLTVRSNTPPGFNSPTNALVFTETISNGFWLTNIVRDFETTDTLTNWVLLTTIPGLVVNATNGLLTWTPTDAQGPSTNNVLVKVTDSGTPPMSSTGTVIITVQELNSFPVPVMPTNTNVLAGDTLTIQLQANDPDIPVNPLTWVPVAITSGATLTTNGLLTYTPGPFDLGTKTEHVRVYDFNADAINQKSLTNDLTFFVQVIRRRIVTNTNLFGTGSLSNAIVEIGTNAAGGHIEFNIPGAGPFKIAPTTALPLLAANTYLDGYTQPGTHPNTKTNGTDAVILIELSGENQSTGSGLSTDSSVTIRGLCLNRFTNSTYPVVIGSCCGTGGFCDTSGDAVEGCFIGTDPSGTVALPNSLGVAFSCAQNSRVGGPDLAQRNLISGSAQDGIQLSGHPANPVIQNNLIGTDRTGTNALPNGGVGISISTDGGGFSSCLIADNVIGGNTSYGVGNASAPNVTLIRNKIGVGADGVTPRGNGSGGVSLSGTGYLVGGTNTADANLIAYNNGIGVDIFGSRITVEGNSIFRNTGRAIKLESTANNGQSAPVLTNASLVAGSVTIQGTLTSSNATYRLEFFHNPDLAPSNAPQAWIFLGATNVTTSASSNASFSVTFTQTLSGGFLTATATDPNGNTSTISDGLALPSRPLLGIALISGQARLLWLTNFSTFILQTNANVALSNGWADVPGAPGVSGSNLFRDFTLTPSPRFFQLRSP